MEKSKKIERIKVVSEMVLTQGKKKQWEEIR